MSVADIISVLNTVSSKAEVMSFVFDCNGSRHS